MARDAPAEGEKNEDEGEVPHFQKFEELEAEEGEPSAGTPRPPEEPDDPLRDTEEAVEDPSELLSPTSPATSRRPDMEADVLYHPSGAPGAYSTARDEEWRGRRVASVGALASLPPTSSGTGWKGRPGYHRATSCRCGSPGTLARASASSAAPTRRSRSTAAPRASGSLECPRANKTVTEVLGPAPRWQARFSPAGATPSSAADASRGEKLEKEFLLKLTRDLGGDTAQVVSEMYSPPRVTSAAGKLRHLGIVPGFALDLTTECGP